MFGFVENESGTKKSELETLDWAGGAMCDPPPGLPWFWLPTLFLQFYSGLQVFLVIRPPSLGRYSTPALEGVFGRGDGEDGGPSSSEPQPPTAESETMRRAELWRAEAGVQRAEVQWLREQVSRLAHGTHPGGGEKNRCHIHSPRPSIHPQYPSL